MTQFVSMLLPSSFLSDFGKRLIIAAGSYVNPGIVLTILENRPELIVLDSRSPIKRLSIRQAISTQYLDKVRRDFRYFNRYTDFSVEVFFDDKLISAEMLSQLANMIMATNKQYSGVVTACHVQANVIHFFVELDVEDQSFFSESIVPMHTYCINSTPPVVASLLPYLIPSDNKVLNDDLTSHFLYHNYVADKIAQTNNAQDQSKDLADPHDAASRREMSAITNINSAITLQHYVMLAHSEQGIATVSSTGQDPVAPAVVESDGIASRSSSYISTIRAVAKQELQTHTFQDIENWADAFNTHHEKLSNSQVVTLFSRVGPWVSNLRDAAELSSASVAGQLAVNVIPYTQLAQEPGFWAIRQFKLLYDPFFDLNKVIDLFERITASVWRQCYVCVNYDPYLGKVVEIEMKVMIYGKWALESEEILKSADKYFAPIRIACLSALNEITNPLHSASSSLDRGITQDTQQRLDRIAIPDVVMQQWRGLLWERESAIVNCIQNGWPMVTE